MRGDLRITTDHLFVNHSGKPKQKTFPGQITSGTHPVQNRANRIVRSLSACRPFVVVRCGHGGNRTLSLSRYAGA